VAYGVSAVPQNRIPQLARKADLENLFDRFSGLQ
jgi:hypothetical protein